MACESVTNVSKVKVADHGSRAAIFDNPGRQDFRLTRFDGCVVVGSTACDWLVEKIGVGAVAVELKGADVKHAAEQVAVGVIHLKASLPAGMRVGALIVCTRYPSTCTSTQLALRRLFDSQRVRAVVKTDGRNLDFESLFR